VAEARRWEGEEMRELHNAQRARAQATAVTSAQRTGL
jgi:hypothetical protein